MIPLTIAPPALKKLAKSKRKYALIFFVGWPVNTNPHHWQETKKDHFVVINLKTNETKTPPAGETPADDAHYTLEENEIIIHTSAFEGKKRTFPVFYIRAEDEAEFKSKFKI